MSTDADVAVRGPAQSAAVVPSAELGMALFILTEIMFFAGLISAFLVLRAGSQDAWPPVGQPRLPIAVTGFNTVALLLSGIALTRAVGRLRRGGGRGMTGWLATAAGLGALFLLVQGAEWVRLVGYGLTMTSSLYGGTFYVLVGAHGLHVLGALVALVVVVVRAHHGAYGPGNDQGPRLCLMYWWFVVGIWPLLYVLVYLR